MMEPTTIFAIGVLTAALLTVFTVETVVLLRRSGEPPQAEVTPRPALPADELPGGRPWARPMRVLLATDGSRCSDAAIQSVAARSWPAGTDVEVATVVHTHVPDIPEITLMGSAAHVQALDEDREKAPGRIEAALKLLTGRPGLAVRSIILEGDPAAVILDQARRERADLIVIGSHGYGPVKKMALGSVSQAVATQADCSVEIVRCPHTDT
jgi:nucleotide-binding universal stress UspA family protein